MSSPELLHLAFNSMTNTLLIQKRRRNREGHAKSKAEARVLPLQPRNTTDYQQPLEARRGMEQFSPTAPGETSPADTLIWYFWLPEL